MSGYPSINRIERTNVEQLLRWNRDLPPPANATETSSCAAILQRLKHLQETNPTACIAASRRVGFRPAEITHERPRDF